MATISNLDVINAAATRTGNNPITAISSDSGPVSSIALTNYEESVKTELALYPWKRATKIVQINRIDPDVQGEPPEPWTAAYQMPDDMLEIRTIKVSGYVADYEVHGDKILCNAGESDEVILHYIWRVPEADWPPWFREGMIRRWEAILLRGVGERFREADARDRAANDSFALARNRDSQSQTPRDPTRSPTLMARGAGSPREIAFGRDWPPR